MGINDVDQSTKKLVALITLSRAYQLGPAPNNSPLLTGDPRSRPFSTNPPPHHSESSAPSCSAH